MWAVYLNSVRISPYNHEEFILIKKNKKKRGSFEIQQYWNDFIKRSFITL